MFRINYIWALLMVVALSSCEQGKYDREIEPPVEVVSGEADFSNMVSIGASFVAGLADGTVYLKSQENSFPNIMAEQMKLAGGGEFVQPLVSDNIGGLLLGGNVIAGPRLWFNGLGPVPVDGTPSTEVSDILTGPFNNMGVPGAKSFHLVAPGYGNLAGVPLGLANPYFARMASSPNITVLEDAATQNASFFIISEIAGNDVLGYATSGGTGVDQTGNFDPSTYGSNDITDPNVFANVLNKVVETMTANGAKGVVGNIPAVTSLPYFTTVPWDPWNPSNIGNEIPALNAFYAQLNGAFAFLQVPERSIIFSETESSGVVIIDDSLANISLQLTAVLIGGGLDVPTATLLGNQFGQSRQATADDLLVLTSRGLLDPDPLNQEYAAFLISQGVPPGDAGLLALNGITYPLADKWVLTTDETASIKTATDAYNASIEAVVAQKGLGFVDAEELLEQLSNGGVASDGFIITGDYVTGGAFSLDGVHLNARGYAFLANEFLKSIDETYGSNFEDAGALVDIGDYPPLYGPILP